MFFQESNSYGLPPLPITADLDEMASVSTQTHRARSEQNHRQPCINHQHVRTRSGVYLFGSECMGKVTGVCG